MDQGLSIEDLRVSVEGKVILDGLSLHIPNGELHAVMGPNGAGKSSLCMALAGHPKYKVENGSIEYNGKNILDQDPPARAKAGLFLAFQSPMEIPGVNLSHFLFSMAKSKEPKLSPISFKKTLDKALQDLGMDISFAQRELNVGFSGGEKKRAEILQLLLSDSSFAILDETDSGVDVDALKVLVKAIGSLKSPKFSALIVTHHKGILDSLAPDRVHLLKDGRIQKSGDIALAKAIEADGYGK